MLQPEPLIEAQYGLDQPIPVQFVRYIQNMLTGDFGVSFNLYKDMQVSSLVGSVAKLSMIYGLCAVIIGTVIGMFLGVFLHYIKIQFGIQLLQLFL